MCNGFNNNNNNNNDFTGQDGHETSKANMQLEIGNSAEGLLLSTSSSLIKRRNAEGLLLSTSSSLIIEENEGVTLHLLHGQSKWMNIDLVT